MTLPLLPFKASDYAGLFTPKLLPPVVPPLADASLPSGGDDDTKLYFLAGVLLLAVFVGGICIVNQNAQIISHLTLITENAAPQRAELTDLITSKPINHETATAYQTA